MASAVSIRAFPMMRKNGKYVIPTAEDTQQAMDFDDETGEVWDE